MHNQNFEEATIYLEKAAQLDPSFAPAFANLWEADWMSRFALGLPWSERALNALRRGLELDPELGEAHTSLGDMEFYGNWNWAGGEAEFRRGVVLDPNSVQSSLHLAGCLHVQGHWQQARQEYQRALRIDPLSSWLNSEFLGLIANMHRYEEFEDQFQKTIVLDPSNAEAYRLAAMTYARQGREADALEAYLKMNTLDGTPPLHVQALERAAKAGGLRQYWRERLKQLQLKSRDERVLPTQFAEAYVHLGEKENAISMLELAFQQHFYPLAWIQVSALWDPLRSEPRFQALVNRMHFPAPVEPLQ